MNQNAEEHVLQCVRGSISVSLPEKRGEKTRETHQTSRHERRRDHETHDLHEEPILQHGKMRPEPTSPANNLHCLNGSLLSQLLLVSAKNGGGEMTNKYHRWGKRPSRA